MTATPTTKQSLTASERVAALLTEPAGDAPNGFIELLDEDTTRRSPAMFAMRFPLVTMIYERWWRPGLGALMKGRRGISMEEEYRLAGELLDLSPGDTVMDIGCGPGNFTRRFSRAVAPDGLAIGYDGSRPMLERAQKESGGDERTLTYVLGAASVLPFKDESVDAVCCFAALHMFPDPFGSLEEMARVLKPGGKLALLVSYKPSRGPMSKVIAVAGPASGIRMFGGKEIRKALEQRGFTVSYQKAEGVAQIIGAERTGD